ncbi:MAG: hypothetical protein LBH80_02040 [Prevotellaceae bacterium]|jgi:hypothetical protein|nr:hypothetical protein [Prevotellaceae bacterium]
MKTPLTVLFLFPFLSLVAQVNTIKVTNREDFIEQTPYDSLRNFPGESVYGLVGQQLYLKGRPADIRRFGYEGFLIDYTKPGGWNKENIYKCSETFLGADSYYSRYGDLAGKYFNVLSVLRHPKAAQDYKSFAHLYYLRLQETSSGDIVYFEYNNTHPHFYPFLTVGFVDKQRQKLTGKRYILRGRNNLESHTIINIKTGIRIYPKSNTIWNFVAIGVEEQNYRLALVLQNEQGEQIALNIESYPLETWVFEYYQAQRYREDFGELNFRRILDGKVTEDMTKQMCRLAWGDPEKIQPYNIAGNSEGSTRLEEWIYGVNRLYFRDNILIDFK